MRQGLSPKDRLWSMRLLDLAALPAILIAVFCLEAGWQVLGNTWLVNVLFGLTVFLCVCAAVARWLERRAAERWNREIEKRNDE